MRFHPMRQAMGRLMPEPPSPVFYARLALRLVLRLLQKGKYKHACMCMHAIRASTLHNGLWRLQLVEETFFSTQVTHHGI